MEPCTPRTGFTVWFTGLSGSGKSTVARRVAAELARRRLPVELLAGGEFRQNISRGLGFSPADRATNVRRIGYVAKLLSRNGVAVITTAVSPDRAVREECRLQIPHFVEVWVDCPLELCEARDPKGLYRRARLGLVEHLPGLDDPYEPPERPELVLRSDVETPDAMAGSVLQRLAELHLLDPPRPDADEVLVKAQLRALQER